MKCKRYEHRTDGHHKFWTIYDPEYNQSTQAWGVRVIYGKIGTEGKENFHFTWSHASSIKYYTDKVYEKLGKGYKLVKLVAGENGILGFTAANGTTKEDEYKKTEKAAIKTLVEYEKPKEKPCEHNQLRKTSALKWKCNACGTQIEFDKPQTVTATVVEEVTQVRRFFDFSALQK